MFCQYATGGNLNFVMLPLPPTRRINAIDSRTQYQAVSSRRLQTHRLLSHPYFIDEIQRDTDRIDTELTDILEDPERFHMLEKPTRFTGEFWRKLLAEPNLIKLVARPPGRPRPTGVIIWRLLSARRIGAWTGQQQADCNIECSGNSMDRVSPAGPKDDDA